MQSVIAAVNDPNFYDRSRLVGKSVGNARFFSDHFGRSEILVGNARFSSSDTSHIIAPFETSSLYYSIQLIYQAWKESYSRPKKLKLLVVESLISKEVIYLFVKIPWWQFFMFSTSEIQESSSIISIFCSQTIAPSNIIWVHTFQRQPHLVLSKNQFFIIYSY